MQKYKRLLLSTTLALPLAAASAGAQQIEIDESALEGKSEECRSLAQFIQDRSEALTGVSAEEIIAALNNDRAEECANLEEQIVANTEEQSEQATEEPVQGESERVTEEVELSEDAEIEGEATVAVPEPNVDVQVPPPEVRVTKQQPQVDIAQPAKEIEVQQSQPQIAVEIPEIIVRVDIPSPQLYVLRSEPEVRVSQADPQVEVQQDEPQISVTQSDPELNVDLGVDPGDSGETSQAQADEEQQSQADEEQAEGAEQQVQGDVSASGGEPQVEIVEAEGQPQMSYESGEPSLAYQAAEPQISVMMAEQPSIEVNRSGEPTITFETPEEREQRRQQQQSAEEQSSGEPTGQESEQNESEQASESSSEESGEQTQTGGQGTSMTVGELLRVEVVSAEGENLGLPDAFININGETHLVLSSGGFLGIGEKQVPVPMSRVTQREDRLVLGSLTEDEIQAANDYEFDANQELPEDEQVNIQSN